MLALEFLGLALELIGGRAFLRGSLRVPFALALAREARLWVA